MRVQAITLPVLMRELAQLATRRGTYIMRAVAGLALYGFGLAIIADSLHSYGNTAARLQRVLGSGDDVLAGVHIMVQIGLHIILPAMVVGTITSERENGTLDLMRMTRLHPWEIVIQKLLARLIPVAALLFLAAPLLTVGYSLGGVSVWDMGAILLNWLFTCLRLASVALLVSAICTSTMAAFFVTYAAIFAALIAMSLLQMWPILMGLFTPLGKVMGYMNQGNWGAIVLGHCGQLLFVLVCLFLTRRFILRPVTINPRSLKTLFRGVDRRVDKLTGRSRKARTTHATHLPHTAPVAWREQSNAVVHRPRHLIRLLLAINIPLIVVLLIISAGSSHGRENMGFTVIMFILWVFVVLALTIYVSNLMSKERVNQTWDVLLTTPLSSGRILTEKLAATPRLCLVLASPMILTILTEAWFEGTGKYGDPGKALLYAILSLGFTAIYLYAVIWVTFAFSLKPRNRGKVVAAALGRIFAVIFVPIVLFAMSGSHDEGLLLLSPMGMLGVLEAEKSECFRHLGWVAFSASLFLGGAIFLHANALRWAKKNLRGKS
jgi:ABC-type transport system involved in multi-copper enzyme maturation permease subunit